MSPESVPQTVVTPRAAATPLAGRALRSWGFGLLIGGALALTRPQRFWPTVIYSSCISLCCWACIDLGRRVVQNGVRRLWPHSMSEREVRWPGWQWMLGVVVVGSILGFTAGTTLGDLFTGEHSRVFSPDVGLRGIAAELLFVVLPAVVITWFFYSRSLLADREAAAQQAQRQAAESRLRLLEAQLEPHMFFNTLANLHVLIGLDPPRAQLMLDRLIAFLRATLSGSLAAQHPLAAEFARTQDYLALMQVRMEERLRVCFDLPQELADIPVPPLLLQPLVENAIKHGLEPSVNGGTITVTASRQEASLVLSVRDTGVGLAQSTDARGSFGLRQVRERLQTLYGSAASLSLTAAADGNGGAVAVVHLPVADR